MIKCGICNSDNHHLAIVCNSCGGYIQNKIGNLDLFSIIWKLFESPVNAFYMIFVSVHKNYMVFLSALAGIGFSFFFIWMNKIGDRSISFVALLGIGIISGPVIGIAFVLCFSFLLFLAIKAFKIYVKFKNVYAAISYALIPIVISVVFILPVELSTFGIFFFTANPSPFIIKPTLYVLLLLLDAICSLWSLMLILIATKVLLDVKWSYIFYILLISVMTFSLYLLKLNQTIFSVF